MRLFLFFSSKPAGLSGWWSECRTLRRRPADPAGGPVSSRREPCVIQEGVLCRPRPNGLPSGGDGRLIRNGVVRVRGGKGGKGGKGAAGGLLEDLEVYTFDIWSSGRLHKRRMK